MDDAILTLTRGTTPLLVSLPHVGTEIPAAMRPEFVERALAVEDTDWHLESLYGFARELGAGVLVPRHSRYVIDLNRPPENTPMYAGANNTELVPTRFFSGDALRRAPFADEKAEHGHAILWDGHSIRSRLPWLFEGRLPDLNLGTAGGTSCAPALRAALADVLARQTSFTHVVDGRFKGGHITRHYGRPQHGVHAIQLEMCWSCYMAEEPPYVVDPARAARLTPVLRALLQATLDWKPDA